MLLLMRRVGEKVRINEKITLQIKEIHTSSVKFVIEGLQEEGGKQEVTQQTNSVDEN